MSENPTEVYMHCQRCFQEAQESGETPRKYARIECGLSPVSSIIVWCARHDSLITEIATPEGHLMFPETDEVVIEQDGNGGAKIQPKPKTKTKTIH